MNNEIPTPRTDAATFDLDIHGDAYLKKDVNQYGMYVDADFVRNLERELIVRERQAEEYFKSGTELNAKYRELLAALESIANDDLCDNDGMGCRCQAVAMEAIAHDPPIFDQIKFKRINIMKQSGIEVIADERRRQIEKEGCTAEHDDSHTEDDLARAAACYAAGARNLMIPGLTNGRQYVWPWGDEWWKPTPGDRIRELTKAGALCAAEIDRLQRARDFDPTPYCAVCRARSRDGCSCPK